MAGSRSRKTVVLLILVWFVWGGLLGWLGKECFALAGYWRAGYFDRVEYVYDWGKFESGQSIEYRVAIENIGYRPVRILSAVPDCSCTIPSLDRDVIDPGQVFSMVVRLNSSGMVGDIHKRVVIKTDSTITPLLVLHLEGVATLQ